MNLAPTIKALNSNVFRPQDAGNDTDNVEFSKILSDSLSNRFNLVSSKINSIFIDPNTGNSDDKDKLIINLHVEMEEEAIRIVTFTDKDGKQIEEITFD